MTPRSETPKDEGPWAWQCRGAAAEAGKLGINAFAVYCALTHFQSAASIEHKRRFSASYEQIAELVGCSRGTVAAALEALEKAKLIRRFSGSNGARRATRNAFFLCSISSPQDGRGSPQYGRHVSTPHGRDVSTPHGRLEKKENSFSAPPQAAAGETEKDEEEGSARSRLRRSGDPSKNDDSRHHLRDLTPEEIEQARRIHEMTKDL
jgi:DNA-binding Lrp family transcriptional regulator